MEQALITDVRCARGAARLVIRDLPDEPCVLGHITRALADAGSRVEMLAKVPGDVRGRMDVILAAPVIETATVAAALANRQAELGFAEVRTDEAVGTVSLHGVGMCASHGLTAAFCAALASVGVRVELMSVSQVRLAALCDAAKLDAAAEALRTAFGLAASPDADRRPVAAAAEGAVLRRPSWRRAALTREAAAAQVAHVGARP